MQILHEYERDNWVAATSYHGGKVRLYDSVSSDSLTPSRRHLLVNDGMIAVIVVPVQQQVVTDSWGWITLCFYADLEGNTYNSLYGRQTIE